MNDLDALPIRLPSGPAIASYSLLFLLALWGVAVAGQAGSADGTAAMQQTPQAEVAPRGQRMAGEIKYGDWRKVCFKTPGTSTVCRTTISGTWDTGQTAVRTDLIERDGEGSARLQLFLPVGLYLPAGVKVSVEPGSAYRLPYVWCLTNTCIAADVADPKLIQQMESGQKLVLEVVDSNVLSVRTTLPLGEFAAARKGAPAQIFEQDVDE